MQAESISRSGSGVLARTGQTREEPVYSYRSPCLSLSPKPPLFSVHPSSILEQAFTRVFCVIGFWFRAVSNCVIRFLIHPRGFMTRFLLDKKPYLSEIYLEWNWSLPEFVISDEVVAEDLSWELLAELS